MLPKPDEAKATSFVLQILAEASQSEAINLQMIVRLCLVGLLGELVIAMGDENADTAKAVSCGLSSKVRVNEYFVGDRRCHQN